MSDKLFLCSLLNAETVTSRVITDEGFLLVNGYVSRPGIYEYYVGELPAESLPVKFKNASHNTIVRILYPDEEILSESFMASVKGKSVTWGHPAEMVNSRNVTFYQNGFVRDEVRVQDSKVYASLCIQHADLITAISKDDLSQTSVGINAETIWAEGIHKEYGQYDGVIRTPLCNHVAIVAKGRAGSSVRLDNVQSNPGMGKGEKMETEIKIGGVTFKVANQVAEALKPLMEKEAVQGKAIEDLTARLMNAQKTVDDLTGQIDILKKSIEDPSRIENAAEARQEICNAAASLVAGIVTKGKTPDAIIKEVVLALANGEKLEGKSTDYLRARFDTYAQLNSKEKSNSEAEAHKVVMKNTHKDGEQKRTSAQALAERKTRFQNAWKKTAR